VKRALALIAACGGSAEPPAPPSTAVAPAPATATADPEPERPAGPRPPPFTHGPGPANDDYPHRVQAIAPWLDHADACIPPADALLRGRPDRGLPGDDDLTVTLDAYADQLVGCGQLLTRRGNSVFFDHVSYACWNVDPKRGTLARRADLPRAYVDCQDGRCEPAAAQWPSYDGKEVVVRDDDRRVFDVFARAPDGRRGKKLRTIAEPADPVGEPSAIVADLGGVLFIAVEDGVVAVDERDHPIAHAKALRADVLDATTVRIVVDPLHVVDVDVAARRALAFALPGCTADELSGRRDQVSAVCDDALVATHLVDAVRFGGMLYAIDNAGRRLDVLDPATYRATATRPLAVCPPP
jgi:hypothetical protein